MGSSQETVISVSRLLPAWTSATETSTGSVTRAPAASTQWTKFLFRLTVFNGFAFGADATVVINGITKTLAWGGGQVGAKAVDVLFNPPAEATEYICEVRFHWAFTPYPGTYSIRLDLVEEWTGSGPGFDPVTPSETTKTVFDGTARWGIPATLAGGQRDQDASITVDWNPSQTSAVGLEFNINMTQVVLAGAEAHIFVNEVEEASFSWGAFDTGLKAAKILVTPVDGVGVRIRIRFQWSGLVAPLTDAYYTIGMTMTATWVGPSPTFNITADQPCADPLLCFLQDYGLYVAVGGVALFGLWLFAPEIQRGIQEFRETVVGLPARAKETILVLPNEILEA